MFKFIKQIKILLILAFILCLIVAVERFCYFSYTTKLYSTKENYFIANQTKVMLLFDFLFPFFLSVIFLLAFYFLHKAQITESNCISKTNNKDGR